MEVEKWKNGLHYFLTPIFRPLEARMLGLASRFILVWEVRDRYFYVSERRSYVISTFRNRA